MKHKVNLEYNVIIWRENKLKTMNVFQEDFIPYIAKWYKKSFIYDIPSLEGYILNYMRRYWCKSEYEILVTGLFSEDKKKIDPFYQIENNITAIAMYVNDMLNLKLL